MTATHFVIARKSSRLCLRGKQMNRQPRLRTIGLHTLAHLSAELKIMDDNFDAATHYPALGYKVKPRVLDISRGVNFVSMKDQIIRGRWVIDALIAAGALSPSSDKLEKDPVRFNLLIIGAGAAGVSAALRAHEKNVRTLIVDRAGLTFARQEHSERLISLSLYD